MEDFEKYITKFLDSYVHDVSYYAIRNKDGCLSVIYIFNHNGKCLAHVGVEHIGRKHNVFTVNSNLFKDMMGIIGINDDSVRKYNSTNTSMYRRYMYNRFRNTIEKYVEDNPCEKGNGWLLSSRYPYSTAINPFGDISLKSVYNLAKDESSRLYQGEVEKLG